MLFTLSNWNNNQKQILNKLNKTNSIKKDMTIGNDSYYYYIYKMIVIIIITFTKWQLLLVNYLHLQNDSYNYFIIYID